MSEEEITIGGKPLKELKASELKSACKERNLPYSGNKNALIKRLKSSIALEKLKLQQAARSSPAGGSLPNSDIADGSGGNDFIKQYMEDQRKLLQSSRFSSTSEADSEDDAISHKSGSVVSPLVTRRSRRTTKESNDSSEPEMPTKIDDQPSEVQATVKSTQDGGKESQSEAVKTGEKKILEDVPQEEHDSLELASESLPVIPEESTEKLQQTKPEDTIMNGEAKDQEESKIEEVEKQQSTLGEEEPSSLANQEEEKTTEPRATDLLKQPDSQGEEEMQVPKGDESEQKPDTQMETLKCESQLPETEPDIEKESCDNKMAETEPVQQVKEEEKVDDVELTTSVANEQESMEVGEIPPKGDEEDVSKEAVEPLKPEIITEETVVDVDEIVNQEEELDYDENDAPTQDKSEAVTENKEDEEQRPVRARRLRLNKDKKERRRSRSDSRKGVEMIEDAPESDATKEIKEEHSRKRRKSTANDDGRSKDDRDLTPEPVERKARKRIKRQSLDTKSKEVDSQQREEIDGDISISDAVEITNAPDEKIDEPEEKTEQEKKNQPDPEPLIPLRRISINKRESSDSNKPRKRKWGGRSTSSENVNISSDLIKNLIDVKPDDIRKAMDDREEPGELVEEEEEEVDEIIDITMEEPAEETEPPDQRSEKHAKHAKEGEEDGEIVEEEEVVVEELEEAESDGEEKSQDVPQHDNRKVVSGKTQRTSELKTETKTRKVVSRSDQKRSSKEESDPTSDRKKESSKRRSSKTSVTVTNKSGPKDPTPPPQPREVSPSRYQPSKIVHVRNLVRPFTVNQLQGLLGKLGKVAEGSFWIDKIKSHCLVTYESIDDAVNARKCLHGIKWPSSNPKQLSVDFCEEARADDIKGVTQEKAIPPLMGNWKGDQKSKSETDEKTKKDESRGRRSMPEDGKDRREERRSDRDRHGKDESAKRKEMQTSPRHSDRRGHRSRDRDRKRSPERGRREDERGGIKRDERAQPLREWDRDKLDQEVEHRRQMRERERERQSPQRSERREGRERKQKEEQKPDEQPAKLLDDLFRKTKATPCIYWLPLTDEQVAKRIQEREERREARNKIRREMEEEEEKNRAKLTAERRERNARSPDRRRLSDRTRRDSTGERRLERRPVARHPARGSRERTSPGKKKSPKTGGDKKAQADSSSDSSSSDSSSGSGSDSDSDSDSSSDSSPKRK